MCRELQAAHLPAESICCQVEAVLRVCGTTGLNHNCLSCAVFGPSASHREQEVITNKEQKWNQVKKKKVSIAAIVCTSHAVFCDVSFFLSSPVSSELSGLCYCSVLPQLYQVISIRLMHLSIKFLLLVAGIGRATCCSIYGELKSFEVINAAKRMQ